MTVTTIDIREAQRTLADLLVRVAAGEEIVLTEGDQPRARLVPVTGSRNKRVPGLHAASMTTTADFDAPLADDFWLSGT
jgi:antitoxin (DNA-binding transcriptional repressor) of toxin-antitoxin stability system